MKKIFLMIGLVALVFSGCPNNPMLEAISITPSKTTYSVGESVAPSDIVVVATYSDGSTKTVSDYTTSPTTFSEAGTITVTVSYSENGVTKTASYEVTVNDPMPPTPETFTVTFNKNNDAATGNMEVQTFTEGIEQALTACGFSLNGYIFLGWAKVANAYEKEFDDEEPILATENMELYAVWEKIPVSVESVTLNQTQIYGQTGEKIQLIATVNPDDADIKTVSWKSSNDEVATVNKDGLVTIVSTTSWEEATITVKTDEGGHKATCKVTVVKIPTDSSDFVKINAGEFSLSSDGSYKVTLTKAFEICKHEVTQAEYQWIMGKNPSYFKNYPAEGEIQNQRPVEQVTWYDAIVYCNRRTEIEGIKIGSSQNIDYVYFSDSGYTSPYTAAEASIKVPVYIKVDNQNKIASLGYRLPTDAEWEIAARGGLNGDVYAGSATDIEAYAQYSANEGIKTHQVMKKKPNSYGLYDMSGNVFEWCWDYLASYPASAVDPIGPTSGPGRICRGGSWSYASLSCKVSARSDFPPVNPRNFIGFRVARSAF